MVSTGRSLLTGDQRFESLFLRQGVGLSVEFAPRSEPMSAATMAASLRPTRSAAKAVLLNRVGPQEYRVSAKAGIPFQ